MENKKNIQGLKYAAIAAVLATVGDCIFMLLFILNQNEWELNTVKIILTVAGLLGAVTIPFYAIGYRAISLLIFSSTSFLSKLFMGVAIVASFFGAAIHGITALKMYEQIERSNLNADPMLSIQSWGGVFLGLWAVAALGTLLVSSIYFCLVFQRKTKLKRSMAYLNPVFITVGISIISVLLGSIGTYITPTAPNIAHIVFFVVVYFTYTDFNDSYADIAGANSLGVDP